jgi:hypothetical protein
MALNVSHNASTCNTYKNWKEVGEKARAVSIENASVTSEEI